MSPLDVTRMYNSDRSIQSVFYLRARYRANSSVVGPPCPQAGLKVGSKANLSPCHCRGGARRGGGLGEGRGRRGGHLLATLALSSRLEHAVHVPPAGSHSLASWLSLAGHTASECHWLSPWRLALTGWLCKHWLSPCLELDPPGWLSMAGCTGSPQAGSHWLVWLRLSPCLD